MLKEWNIKNTNTEEKSLIKRLLYTRGIKTVKDIYEFLHPLEMELTSPTVFCDMQKAIERIVKAIDNKEKIVIYGDFDADGVTSTALLYKTLKHLNADVNYFIPERDKEGHGFDEKALINIMITAKPKLIISVDCGISNVEEVSHIKTYGIDVIITDHHEAPEVLPPAFAIINPKAPNALDENLTTKQLESLTSLCGVGVAFKIAQELLKHYEKTEFILEILPFVAVGTIADIVPLIGENRYFVTRGLQLITKHYGLKRLLESCGYTNEKDITSENIAFGVAPRINASGRLDTVEDAIKILISENKQEIEMSVNNLNEFNKIRQELCKDTFAEAEEMYKKDKNNPAVILCSKNWNVGIIGIVASKFVEKYYKPTFLMTYDEEKNEYRCSARGIEGLSLYEIIKANSDILNGGGHKLAAGFSFSAKEHSFEKVKNIINETLKEMLNGKELKPFIDVDLQLYPQDITIDLVEEIAQLEPFGASNPAPKFMLKDLTMQNKTLMGKDKTHLKLSAQKDNSTLTCIGWGMGDCPLICGNSFDVVFHPQINEFNGEISVQLIIDDIHSDVIKEEEKEDIGIKIYDHRKKNNMLPLINDYVKNSKQNIKIFAECKTTKDLLIPFKNLYCAIFNRDNIQNCDTLMFFDYPADKETFTKIIEETTPSTIYFMKYDIKNYNDSEFLVTFIKMLRFAYNNNNGNVDILRCASALGVSFEIIFSLLDLLEELNFINIQEKNYKFYKIKLLEIKNLNIILENNRFEEIKNLITECKNFQRNLMENDLSSLEIV